MYKLISWYNQNRKKFWVGIIVIIFIFVVIRLLNFFAELQLKEENKQAIENAEQSKNTVSYKEESKGIISGGSVNKEVQNKFGTLIDTFLTNCTSQNYEEAYKYLSDECKKELYPSKKMFIDQYCTEKFEGDKKYSFKAWTSQGTYIYLVKIYENMLSTGNSNVNYIQDYYTIVKEDNEYKLNISSFIGNKKYYNKMGSTDNISIQIKDASVYMNYQVYEINIKNETENTIMLDTREDTDNTYIVNNNNIKIEALLHENKENELIIEPNEEKTIKVKFSSGYKYGETIEKIVFSNIVLNYNEYENDKEIYENYKLLEIGL